MFALSASLGAPAPLAYTAEQQGMEITALPGAPTVPWKQFGGFVDLGPRGSTFFWLVESQRAPATDPLLLWTNGGPGCSGLTGFMTEQGPFRPTANGSLELNPYAWNLEASVVFIEQPVGVGFSKAFGNLTYNDSNAASDNVKFVKGFMKLFPQFAENDFFISSESYGGHYMPTLASALVDDGGVPNFKGFLVGNPLTFLTYRNYGEFGTYAGHQLLPKPLWEQYEAAGCRRAPGLDPGALCANITGAMSKLTAGLDPYALDFPKCNDAPLFEPGRRQRYALMKAVHGNSTAYPYFPTDYQPCTADWATAYLSRKDVQDAIHASTYFAGNWSACSDVVGAAYSQEDVAAPMMPVYEKLLKASPPLKMLIYSGDDDAVCATLGTQQFIWDLGLSVVEPWAPWKMDSGPGCPEGPACKQIAGYATKFDGLSFVTVHGAGHLVPATRPAEGLQVLKNFLSGVW